MFYRSWSHDSICAFSGMIFVGSEQPVMNVFAAVAEWQGILPSPDTGRVWAVPPIQEFLAGVNCKVLRIPAARA